MLLENKSPTHQIRKHFSPEMLKDQHWRLNNLYFIKNQEGRKILFQFNWAQRILAENLHTCNLILKARQLGMTTFFCLLCLDSILWQNNKEAGIIAHTLDDAQNIFSNKIKYPFDNLHPAIRPMFRAVGDSAKELSFAHGSSIRVGTSLRSSTLQHLHISEFGKICAKYPERAREIITGSLNTIAPGQNIYIESTAEGKQGAFYEMVQEAREFKGTLSPIDFRFHFFPWWKHPIYSLGVEVPIPKDLQNYFDKLSLDGIHLTDPQKWWYAAKHKTQKEDIFREFPSSPDEAFSSSQEGFWYASEIKELYENGHILSISYDRALPVHTAWDLGQADSTAIWFFQVNRNDEINIIDFWQGNNTRLDQLAALLQQKAYAYGYHIWPHDAAARDRSGITFVQQARNLGLSGMVLEPHGILQGISLVKTIFSKCWFEKDKCAEGLKMLENYQKKWNASFGGWTSEPLHNEASHCFTGETPVLTDTGICQIMTLPTKGRVWTLNGWKDYHSPRLTRRNASVVEITFSDHTSVKCTEDHLFLTANGWKSAHSLQKGFEIQSSLMKIPSFLTEIYTVYGREKNTVLDLATDSTEMSGKPFTELLSQEDITSIIEMAKKQTIDWPTWNLLKEVSIYHSNGKTITEAGSSTSPINADKRLENGTSHPREGRNIQKSQKDANSERTDLGSKRYANGAENPFKDSQEKEEILRNFAIQIAKPLKVEKIEKKKIRHDVWCLTVPDIEHFSLANGAVVHNCADAFRYLAAGLKKVTGASDSLEKDMSQLRRYWGVG